jgi:hypothetical protein
MRRANGDPPAGLTRPTGNHTGRLLLAHVIGRAGSPRAADPGGIERGAAGSPGRAGDLKRGRAPPDCHRPAAPLLLHPGLVPRPVPHRPAGPARCAGASMKGKAAVGADAAAAPPPPGGRVRGRGLFLRAAWVSRRRSPGAPLRWETQPAGCTRSQLSPRTAPCGPATQDGPGDAAGHRIYPPAG